MSRRTESEPSFLSARVIYRAFHVRNPFTPFPTSYFNPLLIRELRSSIRSALQENAQNLLSCPCKSTKVLHGVYGPPTGQTSAPSASTITSPVYAAAQVSSPCVFVARFNFVSCGPLVSSNI